MAISTSSRRRPSAVLAHGCKHKQKTIYCYSKSERDAASAKLGGKPDITRFKGLGEISPAEFKPFIGKDMRASRVEYAPRVDSQQILSF